MDVMFLFAPASSSIDSVQLQVRKDLRESDANGYNLPTELGQHGVSGDALGDKRQALPPDARGGIVGLERSNCKKIAVRDGGQIDRGPLLDRLSLDQADDAGAADCLQSQRHRA